MSAAWMEFASCAQIGPTAFFPEPGESNKPAKAACSRCPVMDTCLEVALSDPSLVGVWGGTTEKERARIRKRRAIVEEAA